MLEYMLLELDAMLLDSLLELFPVMLVTPPVLAVPGRYEAMLELTIELLELLLEELENSLLPELDAMLLSLLLELLLELLAAGSICISMSV